MKKYDFVKLNKEISRLEFMDKKMYTKIIKSKKYKKPKHKEKFLDEIINEDSEK